MPGLIEEIREQYREEREALFSIARHSRAALDRLDQIIALLTSIEAGLKPAPPAKPAVKLVLLSPEPAMLVITAVTMSDDDPGQVFGTGYEDKFGDDAVAPVGAGPITVSSDDAGAFLAPPTIDAAGVHIAPAGAGKLGVANVTITDGTLSGSCAFTIQAGKAVSLGFGAPAAAPAA